MEGSGLVIAIWLVLPYFLIIARTSKPFIYCYRLPENTFNIGDILKVGLPRKTIFHEAGDIALVD